MSESDSTALPAYDFQALCTPHYQALVHYANRLLPGRPQEALDLVQEAFLKACRRWSTWSPGTGEDASAAARGWLHRIVQNVFLDGARAHAGHRTALHYHHATVIENTYGVETDHNIQILSDGVGDEVRAALSTLDQAQLDVVLRADFQGEQYLAIAEALGIPLGTVMSRLHRGRKRLAAALKDYARESYGISGKDDSAKRRAKRLAVGTRTDIQAAPDDGVDLDGAGAAALTDVPAETVQTEADRVDRVVAWYHGRDLLGR